MFTALLIGILAVGLTVYLLTVLWRVIEGVVQGVVGGVALFWRLASGAVRLAYRTARACKRGAIWLDTELSQRTHAAWWSWSYWLKRNYIASALRARRKERH